MKALSNQIYYQIKPLIPRSIRIKIRGFLARRIMKSSFDRWPIEPFAAHQPESWRGWPDNKKFALVLTHDVESAEGLRNCNKLMEIEESLGFRSSFNLVAGDYEVPEQFRKRLIVRGFEIGIHGLTHKGNPFRSERAFRRQADEINRRLKEWGSVGFRSPSMYHDLRMLHHLEIEYDSSTFDTDPFEPQPDGVRTIFPLWIYDEAKNKGYVELPYTLPQDHLLFLILQEKTIDIWKKKLEWIVSSGGMALVIVHPDYMDFNNRSGLSKYPVKYYNEFLTYIKENYPGQYWNPLPRDLSKYWKENYSNKKNQIKRRLHIAMPAYTFYEMDNRVKRYVRALADSGNDVEVMALKQDESEPSFEIVDGIKLYKVQLRKKKERSALDYLMRQALFLWKTANLLRKIHNNYPIDLIHAHSIPDYEVFSAFYPKLKGARVILDIHDLVPELYLSKFSKTENNLLYRILLFLEKISCNYADHVIVANHLWYRKLISRSVRPEKCSVIMNYPDDNIFYTREKNKENNNFVIIYPGTLSYHQGLDIAIKAMSRVINNYPNTELRIYGDGPAKNDLINLIQEMKLDNNVHIFDLVPLEKICSIMADADLGVVPKRDDPFAGEAFSTKILEFMAIGIPMIVASTKIDKYYFNDSVVKFFKPEDVDDLEKRIIEMITNEELRKMQAVNALKFVKQYMWSSNKDQYIKIINKLTGWEG